jgi:predicted branched-subunit amino acid permease
MNRQHIHTPNKTSRHNWILRALQQTPPIILGYLPVGFAYGVLAQKSGLSSANTMLMSLLVFAGSASSSPWSSLPQEPGWLQSS